VKRLAVTANVVKEPEKALEKIVSKKHSAELERTYERLVLKEKESIRKYVQENQALLTDRYDLIITESRATLIAEVYALNTCDMNGVMKKIKICYDQIKEMLAYFRRSHELNISLHEDAMDVVLLDMCCSQTAPGDFYKKMSTDFQYGLKLVYDKTGKNDFVITKEALENPEAYLNRLVREICAEQNVPDRDTDVPRKERGGRPNQRNE
jgi:ATP-dependent Clp protease ATP-binding subunit ClpX